MLPLSAAVSEVGTVTQPVEAIIISAVDLPDDHATVANCNDLEEKILYDFSDEQFRRYTRLSRSSFEVL